MVWTDTSKKSQKFQQKTSSRYARHTYFSNRAIEGASLPNVTPTAGRPGTNLLLAEANLFHCPVLLILPLSFSSNCKTVYGICWYISTGVEGMFGCLKPCLYGDFTCDIIEVDVSCCWPQFSNISELNLAIQSQT